MSLLYRFLRYLSGLELGHAIYRRDLIDQEMMTGHDIDLQLLMRRRAAIESEVRAALTDYMRWDAALHDLAIRNT